MKAPSSSCVSDDPMLGKFWPKISWNASIRTTPPGVSVFDRNYNAPDNAWELVGRSPIEKRRMPLVDSQWKFELKGFTTAERFNMVMFGNVVPSSSLSVAMDEESKTPAGMIHQTDRFAWEEANVFLAQIIWQRTLKPLSSSAF